jgi:DNA-binding transcriptional LysR family regulator
MSRKTTQLQLIQAGFGVALLPESMQDIAPVGVRFLPLSDPIARAPSPSPIARTPRRWSNTSSRPSQPL